jgi:hypothetical protein
VRDLAVAAPPDLTGPGTTPAFAPSDKPAQFRVLTWSNWEPPPAGRRGRIIQPEYDFGEIAKATDTDGILRNAFDRQLIAIMKERWWVGGKNPRTVAYIQTRLHEISRMSPWGPFDLVLRQCAQDLVEYGNFFLHLHRDTKASSGEPVQIRGKRKDPIAAIHPMDVSTMYPKMGDTLEVRAWHQLLDGRHVAGRQLFSDPSNDRNSKRYSTEDIIHGFSRRRSGFIFGTPPATPVLDDIRALRRLEEIAELIAHKHAFPLIHIAVGSEKKPAKILADGKSELDIIRSEYEKMPLEGAFITSERVVVKGITADSMDLTSLLKHYQDRAVTGLGLSDVDMGRGGTSNRGTALVLSRSMMDRARDFQQLLCVFITWQLFDILLAEGGFDPTPENRVWLRFPEVDIERLMEVNNHAMALYQGHSISETEMRAMMGRDPMSDEDRKDMFFEHVAKPMAIIKAVDEPFSSASTNLTKSKNQPTNQSGTKLARTTPKNDKVSSRLEDLQDRCQTYVRQKLENGEPIGTTPIREFFQNMQQDALGCLAEDFVDRIKDGFERYNNDSRSGRTFVVGETLRKRFTKHALVDPLDRLVGDECERLVEQLRTATDDRYFLRISAFFDNWALAWDRFLTRLHNVAERFGYAQAAWLDDAHEVVWQFDGEPCRRCRDLQDDPLTPMLANYYTLGDRCCEAELKIADSDRLPSRIRLDVSKVVPTGQGFQVFLDADHPESLDLTGTSRFVRILLDTGEQVLLPDEAVGGWGYDGSGMIRVPKNDSGVVELWDQGRIVARTRFNQPIGAKA